MKFRHPSFSYDARRTEQVIEKPCYMYTTFIPRRQGRMMTSASVHPFELLLVKSVVGEFDASNPLPPADSQTIPKENYSYASDFFIAGAVDFAQDDVLAYTYDDQEPSDTDESAITFAFWTRYGFSSVFEIQPECVYEAVLQGRLFRITAARILGYNDQDWTVAIDELEPTGYWYRYTFASEIAPQGTSADAIKTGVSMITAHLSRSAIHAST